MICSIILNTTSPDVQPWSEANSFNMYSSKSHHLEISIEKKGLKTYQDHFHEVPHSLLGPERQFIEEPSDQTAQGLRKFQEVLIPYKEKASGREAIRRWEKDVAEERRRRIGKPIVNNMYYEYIQNNRVKYFIYCGIDSTCHLNFPWGRTLMIDIHLDLSALPHAVAMADKISDKLREFEAAGLARKATMAATYSFINSTLNHEFK